MAIPSMEEVRAFWEDLTHGRKVSRDQTLAAFARVLSHVGDLETRIFELENPGPPDCCQVLLYSEEGDPEPIRCGRRDTHEHHVRWDGEDPA